MPREPLLGDAEHGWEAPGAAIAVARQGDSAGRSAVEAWAQVCAPSVAVAALFDLDHR